MQQKINIEGKTVKETLFDEEECKIIFTDGTVLFIDPMGGSNFIECLIYRLEKEKN